MSLTQSSPTFRLSFADRRSALDLRTCIGMGLLALGFGLFAVGVYHGFEHGSCSTTGYSANYGPIRRCAQGVAWWMLLLMVGLVVTGGAAVLSKTARRLLPGGSFIAIGVPFLALALFTGNIQLLQNASSGAGKVFSGIFGACFLLAGLAWAGLAGRNALSRQSAGSLLGSLLAMILAIGLALGIGAATANAIGTPATPANHPISRSGTHAITGTNPAITKAQAAADRARKLAACISAAGTDTAQIQACEAKYKP